MRTSSGWILAVLLSLATLCRCIAFSRSASSTSSTSGGGSAQWNDTTKASYGAFLELHERLADEGRLHQAATGHIYILWTPLHQAELVRYGAMLIGKRLEPHPVFNATQTVDLSEVTPPNNMLVHTAVLVFVPEQDLWMAMEVYDSGMYFSTHGTQREAKETLQKRATGALLVFRKEDPVDHRELEGLMRSLKIVLKSVAKGKEYHPLGNNCHHFASEVYRATTQRILLHPKLQCKVGHLDCF